MGDPTPMNQSSAAVSASIPLSEEDAAGRAWGREHEYAKAGCDRDESRRFHVRASARMRVAAICKIKIAIQVG